MAGLIGRLLSFTRVVRRSGRVNASDVKVSTTLTRTLQVDHYAAPGDDSHPLPGDYAAIVPIVQTGRAAAVGYADPAKAGLANRGEKRLFARDSLGDPVATVWLHNDGQIEIFNDTGSATIDPDGTITHTNGAATITLDPAGSVTIENDAVSATFDPLGNATIANAVGSLRLLASGIVQINNTIQVDPTGNITMTGTIITTGTITCSDMITTGTGDLMPFNTHFHTGVTPGGSNTGGPDA